MNEDLDRLLPTIDLDFMCELIERSTRVIDRVKVGGTTAYVLSGNRPIGERTFPVRDVGDNCVSFNFATAYAIRLGQMGPLLEWLALNKKWKDGGYFE